MGGDNGPGDLGFVRNRGPHVVRLKRSPAGTPPEGTYRCVVQDATKKNQTVYVRLMNGMWYNVFFAQTYIQCNNFQRPALPQPSLLPKRLETLSFLQSLSLSTVKSVYLLPFQGQVMEQHRPQLTPLTSLRDLLSVAYLQP